MQRPWCLLFQNESLVIQPPFPPDGRTTQTLQRPLNTFISTNKSSEWLTSDLLSFPMHTAS